MKAPQKVKLTYFNIEGVAEKVRLALLLTGTPFEDERIAFPQWAEMKPKTPYGQLPVMKIDDGEEFAQSGAMLRWAGRLGDSSLYPVEDAKKVMEIEEVLGLCDDLSKAWGPALYISMAPQNFGYPPEFSKTDEGKAKVKELREKFVAEKLPDLMKYFGSKLKKHGGDKFLCGDKPTIADLTAVPLFRNFQKGHIDFVPKDCLDKYEDICAYIKRFMELPPVAEWYASKA
uniref:GST N-terminal domain-containing protein n=1 Tax=Chromera velia CCMP2878 TaxID=1169474 RepID=A0A0G4I631_9ALVE|eukprot:Cvel_11281.t1-p1 / transcript=Cvel_11281.t1 / gene=Cvel_11281 / organism=Chromera_velia_CCMP2878 / gene_product=Glutathione S-transferase 1, putative / transcript_product=Glutathione S-transferase 1, putative / location=Cvel_scaffold704:21179-23062(+) / protein_length=229 / sequence_SO=supercontig / SO=protein_coding / is_pseudo=false